MYAAGLDVHGIGIVKVYSLMEHEMDALGSASARMNIAMGSFFACAGALVSAVLSYLTIQDSERHPMATAIYVAAMLALAGLSALSGLLCRAFMQERSAMVAKIIKRSAVAVRLEPVQATSKADSPALS